MSDTENTVQADDVVDVSRYRGCKACSYECTNPAHYNIKMKKDGGTVWIPACHKCAKQNGVRPGEYNV